MHESGDSHALKGPFMASVHLEPLHEIPRWSLHRYNSRVSSFIISDLLHHSSLTTAVGTHSVFRFSLSLSSQDSVDYSFSYPFNWRIRRFYEYLVMIGGSSFPHSSNTQLHSSRWWCEGRTSRGILPSRPPLYSCHLRVLYSRSSFLAHSDPKSNSPPFNMSSLSYLNIILWGLFVLSIFHLGLLCRSRIWSSNVLLSSLPICIGEELEWNGVDISFIDVTNLRSLWRFHLSLSGSTLSEFFFLLGKASVGVDPSNPHSSLKYLLVFISHLSLTGVSLEQVFFYFIVHLDTIPATESDEFIKSSVENLVPTPIEFEDFFDDECDLPPYDDSSKNHDFTFSNPLFDIDEDFTLSDESFSEEDIPKENFIIFSNPLFDLDEEIASTKVDRINDEVLEGIHSIPPGIDSFDAESDLVESVLNRDISIDSSPKIDSLSNEFAGELILPKSIPPEIEEVEFDPEGDILFLESLLYDNSSPRPPEALQANSNAIESLPPSHIPVADNDSLMEEIDLFLADDGSIPPGIESDDVDSVDDDTSISLPEFESFYVDYPNSGNSTIDVVEDIPVDVPNVLPTHPILEQDFIPTSEFFAYVVWIFLPFLAYPVIPPSLLSCGDEDTIFDPGISKDCPDCEDSQFCHSSRVSHLQLQLGIRYPNLID
ncbi:hypothetical protein Tco_0449067 [Tanacetum coccineum]